MFLHAYAITWTADWYIRPATSNDLNACLRLQEQCHKKGIKLEDSACFTSILTHGLSWVACPAPLPGPRKLNEVLDSTPIGYVLVHLGTPSELNACVPALPAEFKGETSTVPWHLHDVVVHPDRRGQGACGSNFLKVIRTECTSRSDSDVRSLQELPRIW